VFCAGVRVEGESVLSVENEQVGGDAGLISVGFISLGCAKNLVDSQTMAGALLAEGLTLAPTPEDADVVIVNTCAFIEDAREESAEMILAACQLKQEGACRAVIVAGCLPQRYRDKVESGFPDVDAFIGLDQLDEIPSIVRRVASGHRGIMEVSAHATRLFESKAPVVFTGGPYAYLKIAEGCNHKCAFCAIPGIRGRHRSRTAERIVSEARRLINSGFRELNVISQDVTAYGRDLEGGHTLASLVRSLAELEGDYWLRLLYAYPSTVTDELLAVMGEFPVVCHYLDVPLQHSHPDLLRAMHRADMVKHVSGMAARLREALPGATLRTTFLVGFPGETDAHVDHLVDYVRESQFDHVGVFVYSPEEGTPAYEMDGLPDLEVAEARLARVMEAQQEVVASRAAARVGMVSEFLLESPDADAPDLWRARSRGQAPEVDGITRIAGCGTQVKMGDFVRARFTGCEGYDMNAQLLHG
jgi:ribosomal protein S12 methylthiotransferase